MIQLVRLLMMVCFKDPNLSLSVILKSIYITCIIMHIYVRMTVQISDIYSKIKTF